MRTVAEIRDELRAAFDGKGLLVGGQPLTASPHFDDYVRIGRFLSCGTREPLLRAALVALDETMTARAGKRVFKSSRAVSHFDAQRRAHGAGTAVPKDPDFAKLLTATLDSFERDHGFVCLGERLPNYAGFVFGHVFREAIAQKQHWKDVGAGPAHGEYTHRLQWYLLIHARIVTSVPPNQEADVYQSIAPWQKGKTNLWTFLFDRMRSEDPVVRDDADDFRCPENLNEWLTGDAAPDFCPVLRAFLRARESKRQATYDMRTYLAKKLQIDANAAQQLLEQMQLERMETGRNPSARIVHPRGAEPRLGKYAA